MTIGVGDRGNGAQRLVERVAIGEVHPPRGDRRQRVRLRADDRRLQQLGELDESREPRGSAGEAIGDQERRLGRDEKLRRFGDGARICLRRRGERQLRHPRRAVHGRRWGAPGARCRRRSPRDRTAVSSRSCRRAPPTRRSAAATSACRPTSCSRATIAAASCTLCTHSTPGAPHASHRACCRAPGRPARDRTTRCRGPSTRAAVRPSRAPSPRAACPSILK